MQVRDWLRTPAGAAVLSFVFPGLGLVPLGRTRRALALALPAVALTGLAIVVFLFDRRAISQSVFSEQAVTALVLADLILLVYRVGAVVDSYRMASAAARPDPAFVSFMGADGPPQPPRKLASRRSGRALGRANAGVLAVVILVASGSHLAMAAVGVEYRDTLSCIFNEDAPCWFGSGDLGPGETAPPVVGEDTPMPDQTLPTFIAVGTPYQSLPTFSMAPVTPGPETADGIPIFPVENVSGPNTPPEQWADDGFLNVLLVGADSGVGRWSLRPDTMILLQVEISSGRAVMYGIPRNLENVPLPPEAADAFECHCFPYPNLLNGLWRDAVNRPKAYPYPGSDFVRGFKALEGAIGQYLGLHVDGTVLVNLMGFVNLVNALGGVDINVPTALKDSRYPRPQDGKMISISIPAGQQHMDGYTALAYARSRHQDSDYGRMVRQQAVLMALRAELNPCELLPRVPDLIGALGSTFWTDMPVEDAPQLAALAQRIGTSNVKNVALVPSLTGNPVGFLTIPRWMTVRNIVAHGLDDVPPSSSGGGGGGGGLGC
jgi:LCP family protein required for cell wall assembly